MLSADLAASSGQRCRPVTLPRSGRSLRAPGLGSVEVDAIGAEGSCPAGAEACHLHSSSGLRVNEVTTVSQALSGPVWLVLEKQRRKCEKAS